MSNSNGQVGDLIVDRTGWIAILIDTSVLQSDPFGGQSEVYDVGLSLRNSRGQWVVGQRVKLKDYRPVISLEKAIDVLEKQGLDFTTKPFLEPELTPEQKRIQDLEARLAKLEAK